MDIDAVIAEATPVVAPQAPASTEAPVDTALPKQDDAAPAPETPELKDKPDSELNADQLAKREANRKSHLDSKLAKMRRENRELREAVERNQTPQATTPPPQAPTQPNVAGRPQEKDFSNWGDFLRADARWEAQQLLNEKIAEFTTKAQNETRVSEFQAQIGKRIESVAAQEAEFAKANPEYTALYNDHADFMGNLPKPVAEALLEADNASLALFALMKEGKLEALEDMSPYKLSMEIGKAEIRGESYLNQKKATSAPTPIEATKGSGNSIKSLENKSVEELLKHFNTR